MRIDRDLREYCFDLYASHMAARNKDKKNRNVDWEIPKKTKTESKE